MHFASFFGKSGGNSAYESLNHMAGGGEEGDSGSPAGECVRGVHFALDLAQECARLAAVYMNMCAAPKPRDLAPDVPRERRAGACGFIG